MCAYVGVGGSVRASVGFVRSVAVLLCCHVAVLPCCCVAVLLCRCVAVLSHILLDLHLT